MAVALKDQNSIFNNVLNVEGFYKFVDNLGKMKNPQHYNASEYAAMVFLDKNNILHTKVVDLSSNIDISIKELEVEVGESLIEKKLGLPIRKYKILKNYKQAEKFYEEAISEAKEHQAPKFKVYLDINYVDNFHSFDRKKFDFLTYGDNWRNMDKFIRSESNINSRFDIVYFMEFLNKASDLNLKELSEDSYSWIPKDLMEIALHPDSKEFLDLNEEDEKVLNRKYLTLALFDEKWLKDSDYSSVMHNVLSIVRKREEGYFACLNDNEFNKIIGEKFDNSTTMGQGLIAYMNKNWNNYAPYEKYFGQYRERKNSEDVLMSIFPPEGNAKYVMSINFNPDEAWGYASNQLRGYYSQFRSINEFEKIFKIVDADGLMTEVEVFNHDYKKLYTAVLKSEFPIDENKIKSDFLHVLKIAGEVQSDPEIAKAKVWNEETEGLSDEHFVAIAERKNDLKNDFKVVQRKRI